MANILLRVKKVFFGAYPSNKSEELFQKASLLFDHLVKAKNVFETTLANGNPEVHPGPCVLSASNIDNYDGSFYLYVQGYTDHTINVLLSISQERLALGKALGLDLEDAIQARIARGYLVDHGGSIPEMFHNSKIYPYAPGPDTLETRYLTEDTCGLVLWSSIGRAVNVPTPNIDAVITLAGTLLSRDFWKEGITLEKIGLSGLSTESIIEAVS